MSDAITNHFLGLEEAEKYDRYRPYFHPLVFTRLTELTATRRFGFALDVGCGTGQSTQAMSEIATHVVGLDASAAMLRQARRRGFTCLCARAEELPLASTAFDLVGIGLAFHWFDPPAALREARRVLQPGGWLLVFNSVFAGVMRENNAFAPWWQEYLRKFPSPPRNAGPLGADAVASAGFREAVSERFEHERAFSREELIGYLMTQSNVTAATASGKQSPDSVHTWLMSTLDPLFEAPRGTFVYSGFLSLYEAAS